MARLLYFGTLPRELGTAAEDAPLPPDVSNVEVLLAWLRTRGGHWAKLLFDDVVTVTVNKQFAEGDTPVTDADEVAIVYKGPRR